LNLGDDCCEVVISRQPEGGRTASSDAIKI